MRAATRIFREGRLSIGLFFPLSAFPVGARPDMRDQLRLAQLAEAMGYEALWARDVPLEDPSFGDPGQLYDAWVWLAFVASATKRIALGTGSTILSLRSPIEVAKAAASLDRLSGERLVLGTASGDRPVEFAIYGLDHERRGERFRAAFLQIKTLLQGGSPALGEGSAAARFVPEPRSPIPMLITGSCQSPPSFGPARADGLLTYPRPPQLQAQAAARWRAMVPDGRFKPIAQSLYVDLASDPARAPTPIHLGWRMGRDQLTVLLRAYRDAGVNHVALNLRFCERPVETVMEEIARHALPAVERG